MFQPGVVGQRADLYCAVLRLYVTQFGQAAQVNEPCGLKTPITHLGDYVGPPGHQAAAGFGQRATNLV